MSSAKTHVAVAPNVPTLAGSQIQKEYSTDEPLNRQNSLGNNRRGNMKGKHLTRSHAMRESTSPPRTPTPRNDQQLLSPNGQTANSYSNSNQHHHHQQHHEPNDNSNSNHSNYNNNKLHGQSSAATSPLLETPSVIVTSQHSQQQQQQQKQNVVICNEADFPKLTPPKSSKSPRNNNNNHSSNNNNNNHREIGDKNSNVAGDNNKMEYSGGSGGSSSSSSNGKKSVADNNNKATASNNTHNNNNSSHSHSSNNHNNNNKNQHPTYSSTSGANAMQLALNVADTSVNKQQTPTTATTSTTANVYNSSMNYQLKTDGNTTQPQQQHCSNNMYDKENRCPRNDSQNSNNSMSHDDSQNNVSENHYDRASGGGGGNNSVAMMNNSMGGGSSGGSGVGVAGKKHRTTSNSKGTKPRLKNMGSSSSMDGGNSNSTSGFISRDSSMEQFTDQSGIDLLTFFKETLNKNPKDRNTLMKIEKDLIELAQDKTRSEIRFPATSSYNRMLIHRTAAFFGMEHNVDAETQQCVIVATTKGTRIPDVRFKTLFRDRMSDEPRKSILKRDTHSFDDSRQSSYLCPDRGMLDRKAKSFEEREEDYEKARRRIFRNQQQQQQHQQQQQQQQADNSGDCEETYFNWSSSVEQQQQQQQSRMRHSGKMLKVQTSAEGRDGRAMGVSKANSFSGYSAPPSSGGPPLLRGDSSKSSGSRVFSKQDSMGTSSSTPWRLSPSSSGYKTQTQSVHSDSVTPSPTGYGSDDHTPEPSVISCQSPPPPPPPTQPSPSPLQPLGDTATVGLSCTTTSSGSALSPSSSCGLVWAVTDISSVPKGSVLINPHTLQPIVNQDGSIYHFDPSNLPPSQAITPGMYSQGGAPNHSNYAQPAATVKKSKQQHKNSQIDYSATSPAATTKCSSSTETCSESSTQTVDVAAEQQQQQLVVQSESSASNVLTMREMVNIQEEETSAANDDTDECENTATSCCLSVTTTTSTKSYDRIEIQKFKNQATSPNIPTSPAEPEELPVLVESAVSREQPSRSQYQCPTPSSSMQQQQQQQRDTPNSARSTPYSNADSNTKRSSEESKASPWTYTQSYQAPDGSTVFHTSNGNPYCTSATYQQAPDGSVYAIPHSMVYAYPPQMDADMQGYFMPVYDPAHQRPEATGIIPAGAQAIYSAAGGAATVVPMATAYPSAQFATAAGTPLYPGQVLYSSEQFPAGGATVATNAAAANAAGPLQQYPVTTYPIGYPYPYNGYWGQTMTTYYVPQQTLTNAVTGAPLLPAPPPPQSAAGAVAGTHLVGAPNGGGASLAGNIMVAAAAAGPPSTVLPGSSHSHAVSGAGGYQHSSGMYNGGIAGRVKRTTPPYQNSGYSAQSAAAQSNHHAANAAGIATAYQLGHAMPTFTLATTANAAAAANDLSGSAAAPGTTMYAIPQHAMFPASMLPYAAAPQASGAGSVLASVAPQHHAHHSAAGAAGAAHAHQSNTVISPLFSHPPQLFAQSAAAGATHAPGPSAIAIVDPATVGHSVAVGGTQQSATTNSGGGYIGSSTPQSAPSTPHSFPGHQHQRNPPLFATPPISAAGAVNYHYYTGSSDSQNYAHSATNSHSHAYASSYEKRNGGAASGKKSAYANSNNNISSSYTAAQGRQSTSGGYSGANKTILNNANDTRSSPNSGISVSSNYQGNRPHAMNNKRSTEKSSTSLLNGPPVPTYVASHNAHNHSSSPADQSSKTSRMNTSSGSSGGYRQKPSGFDFRRSASQRNSPSTNSSNESNNNSPSSIVSSPPSSAAYTTSYVTSAGAVSGEQQPAPSLYITRGPHIPPTMAPHGASGLHGQPGAVGPHGSHQANTAAVLGGAAAAAAAAEVANAAVAAAAVATGHQPLLGAYNPSAPTAGVYIKYGQTYFAHPTVALPNSRRSPQSDLRPPMAPMPGMYPAVNMMLSAPTRPMQPRHPNPNYKGTRPSR